MMVGYQLKAQNISESSFYKSFQKNFSIPPELNYKKPQHYFFSLKLKTNKEGVITSYVTNESTDSIYKKIIPKTFNLLDKNGLKSFGLKNATLVLPVFIFNTTPADIIEYKDLELPLNKLWNFNGSANYTKCILLPPVVVYFRINKGIIN